MFASSTDLGRAVALDIRDGLAGAARQRMAWTLGLPSGRTCIPVLAELERTNGVEWDALRLVMPDAYCTKEEGRFALCSRPAIESVYSFIQTHLPSFWSAIPSGRTSEHILVPDPSALGSLDSV